MEATLKKKLIYSNTETRIGSNITNGTETRDKEKGQYLMGSWLLDSGYFL